MTENKNTIGVCLLLWMVFTLILIFTVIGMLLFIPQDTGAKSSWMKIGNDLKDALIK